MGDNQSSFARTTSGYGWKNPSFNAYVTVQREWDSFATESRPNKKLEALRTNYVQLMENILFVKDPNERENYYNRILCAIALCRCNPATGVGLNALLQQFLSEIGSPKIHVNEKLSPIVDFSNNNNDSNSNSYMLNYNGSSKRSTSKVDWVSPQQVIKGMDKFALLLESQLLDGNYYLTFLPGTMRDTKPFTKGGYKSIAVYFYFSLEENQKLPVWQLTTDPAHIHILLSKEWDGQTQATLWKEEDYIAVASSLSAKLNGDLRY